MCHRLHVGLDSLYFGHAGDDVQIIARSAFKAFEDIYDSAHGDSHAGVSFK